MANALLDAIITCPTCGHQELVRKPLTVWPCPACGSTLRPPPGEHCIYASIPCPPVQRAELTKQRIELEEE